MLGPGSSPDPNIYYKTNKKQWLPRWQPIRKERSLNAKTGRSHGLPVMYPTHFSVKNTKQMDTELFICFVRSSRVICEPTIHPLMEDHSNRITNSTGN